MITNIGCDIVSINRISKQKDEFYKRVLTSKEQDIYLSLNNNQKPKFLAGRFAAKEAIFKSCNETKILSNIEVLNDKSGRPYCNIEGFNISVSISHEEEYAIAYAICEKVKEV
ncbi:MAG: holo-ACP synthase [Tenericutes bacterium]|nr:holo-ACP synthase [Mycoplasmatota bacterium]